MDINLAYQFKNYTGFDFETVYNKHKPKLVWYLTKYTKCQEISEDFADEAFMQALDKITSFNKDKSQIHTWIYKIAENMVKKEFKDKQRLGVVALDDSENNGNDLINVITSGDINNNHKNEIDAITTKKAEYVNEAIQNLPEKYKTIMTYRELMNKSYLEIADLCSKLIMIDLNADQELLLPTPEEFMSIEIENDSNTDSFIQFIVNGAEPIELKIEAKTSFKIDKSEINNLSEIKIISNGYLFGYYIVSTNLSTVKSQISKGRQLIQEAVKKKFELLDKHGLY